MPLGLFMQHVMRSTDGSSEFLDRVSEFLSFHNIREIHILDNNHTRHTYKLKKLGNGSYKLNTKKILNASSELASDILTILIFGSQIEEFARFLSFRKLKLGQVLWRLY